MKETVSLQEAVKLLWNTFQVPEVKAKGGHPGSPAKTERYENGSLKPAFWKRRDRLYVMYGFGP